MAALDCPTTIKKLAKKKKKKKILVKLEIDNALGQAISQHLP
jgi:hypothetical protein